jgi:predicted ester cyclase
VADSAKQGQTGAGKAGKLSVQDNKDIVRRSFAAMTAGPETWRAEHDQLFHSRLVGHFAGMPPIDGPSHLQFGLDTFEPFPDLEKTVDDLVGEGDKVVARWTTWGTHTGSFQGIPPTGRRVSLTGITIFRLEEGRIVEEWSESDTLGLLQQIGAIPSAA